jgi:hypothetical protein
LVQPDLTIKGACIFGSVYLLLEIEFLFVIMIRNQVVIGFFISAGNNNKIQNEANKCNEGNYDSCSPIYFPNRMFL